MHKSWTYKSRQSLKENYLRYFDPWYCYASEKTLGCQIPQTWYLVEWCPDFLHNKQPKLCCKFHDLSIASYGRSSDPSALLSLIILQHFQSNFWLQKCKRMPCILLSISAECGQMWRHWTCVYGTMHHHSQLRPCPDDWREFFLPDPLRTPEWLNR